MKSIRLPVRTMVELVLRCGDIDSRYVDSSAMLNGAKAHRRLQKAMGGDYKAEVSLQVETMMGDIPVVIQGRADGVFHNEEGRLTIDEIKTTTLPLDKLYEQRELHLGQAKCYCVMLLQTIDEPPDEVGIQLTYYQLDTDELRRHRWTFSRQELDQFFAELMDRYSVWLHFQRDWKILRDDSIRITDFPFPSYRKGQREMAVAVYRTIERQKKLYVQAPTGIGKTLSALFPSIKAMGEEKTEKLFYLTAKTVTRTVAEDAVALLGGAGLRFKSVTLRAKDKICFQDETVCNPDACPFAKGHYDRINDAVLDVLNQVDLITPNLVEQYAEKHRVCPHELALDLASWADLVICDYNHVFDPTVYLRRFFGDNSGDYVFLIDEAHNMVDRVRDMYTADLRKQDFYRLQRALKDKKPAAARLRKSLGRLNRYLLELRKSCDGKPMVTTELDLELLDGVLAFTAAAEEWLAVEQHTAHPLHHDVLEQYFAALSFAGIAQLYNERYTGIIEPEGAQVTVTLFCLDPSGIIAECLKRGKASVFFSATLTPLPYYREILGGSEGDGILSLPSPFDPGRLLLMAHCGISTKYADRPDSLLPIAQAIYACTAKKRGNYLVYFPSYAYMSQVQELFAAEYPEVDILVQQSRMSEEERADFLLRFDSENPRTLVGFCVLGGIFSEGIDLKGERLIGSVIVGVGLPGLSLRQDLIRDYYNRRGGVGYDYAYVFPGMNKVLQATGRVIRSETDYGVALLIDTRFRTPGYHRLYPSYWSELQMIYTQEQLKDRIEKFPLFQST